MLTPELPISVSYAVIAHKGDKILVFSQPISHLVLTDEQAQSLAAQLLPPKTAEVLSS